MSAAVPPRTDRIVPGGKTRLPRAVRVNVQHQRVALGFRQRFVAHVARAATVNHRLLQPVISSVVQDIRRPLQRAGRDRPTFQFMPQVIWHGSMHQPHAFPGHAVGQPCRRGARRTLASTHGVRAWTNRSLAANT